MITEEEYKSERRQLNMLGLKGDYNVSTLVARFKFGKEAGWGLGFVAREKRKAVRERIGTLYERRAGEVKGEDNLFAYMRARGFEKDGLHFYDLERHISVILEPSLLFLRLTLYAHSENSDEKLKEILDLGALDKFVLTGELPEVVSREALNEFVLKGRSLRKSVEG